MTRPPLTADEMRSMWHDGDAFAQIAEKARLRNGLSRAAVRALIFGEPAATHPRTGAAALRVPHARGSGASSPPHSAPNSPEAQHDLA